MKRVRQCIYSLVFVLSLVASLTVSSGTANAASDYDSFLRVSPSLYVYTDGSAKTHKMDISATWWAEYKQTYAKRVAQNIGWPTNFVTEFEDIMTSGGSWGLYMQDTPDGNMVSIIGTHDPNAYCGFIGSAGSGFYQCRSNPGYGYVRADYFTHNSYGGNGCYGSFGNRCSDTGMNAYSAPIIQQPGTYGYIAFSMDDILMADYHFFFMNFDLNYPSGYEGERIPTEPPSTEYVAMGDSASGGEGNSPYEAGTAVNGVNGCHRSPLAYPRLLQYSRELGSTAFVACSGATIANVTGGQWNEPAQLDALTSGTHVVTLTVGANDAGFSDYALGCIVVCGPGTPIYNAMMSGITQPAFKTNLIYTYEQILSEAPNADLYVADYPYLSKPTTTACWGLDFSGAYNVQTALNGVIEAAVDEAGQSNSRIHLVKTNDSGSPFEGGELCDGSGASLFLGIVPPPNTAQSSLHPNVQGQSAYATVFADAIS